MTTADKANKQMLPDIVRMLWAIYIAGCALVLVSSALVISAYITGRSDFTGLLPGQGPVQSSTAICLLLLSISALLIHCPNKGLSVAGKILGGFVSACALATFLENYTGSDFGLTHSWWQTSEDSAGLTFPGPMAATLSIIFFLFGLAVAMPRSIAMQFQLDRGILAIVALMSIFPFISSSCGIPIICDIRSCIRFAPVTGALCTILSISGILAVPETGVISFACINTISGIITRSLVCLLLVWSGLFVLRAGAVSKGLCNEPVGWWIFGIAGLIATGGCVALISGKLNSEAERKRLDFEQQLKVVTALAESSAGANGADATKRLPQKLKSLCLECGREFTGSELELCPDDGTRLSVVLDDDIVGTTIDRKYMIESVLGKGGMSVVYKAQHLLLSKEVAIKVLRVHLQSDREAIIRFQHEAKTASIINHQNVINVFDFGVTDDGKAFIVMDYIEGFSLSELIEREGPLPLAKALPIFSQIGAGLMAAHAHGIIHRDLKPGNIMLIGENGNTIAKVVDFGLAKLINSDMKLTQTGHICGSPLYMSPEQFAGIPIDTRTDVYSLGCIMYECLCKIPPFNGETFMEVVEKQNTTVPTFQDSLGVPDWLKQIILKALKLKPDNRFSSVAEISQLLAMHLEVSDVSG